MFKREALRFALLAAAALPAAAQDTRREFRPEFNLYMQADDRTRVLFRGDLQQGENVNYSQGSVLAAVDFALRPLFRRDLRQRGNVFRSRYLSFRIGYQYRGSFVTGGSAPEHRGIAELTGRYPLPGHIVIIDRNRGDFRFVKGQAYSSRYRNRLWVERDLKVRGIVFTPYIFGELFFDTRFDAWSTRRFALGGQIQTGPHVVLEPYAMRQVNTRSTPRLTEALGFKLNLFF